MHLNADIIPGGDNLVWDMGTSSWIGVAYYIAFCILFSGGIFSIVTAPIMFIPWFIAVLVMSFATLMTLAG